MIERTFYFKSIVFFYGEWYFFFDWFLGWEIGITKKAKLFGAKKAVYQKKMQLNSSSKIKEPSSALQLFSLARHSSGIFSSNSLQYTYLIFISLITSPESPPSLADRMVSTECLLRDRPRHCHLLGPCLARKRSRSKNLSVLRMHIVFFVILHTVKSLVLAHLV